MCAQPTDTKCKQVYKRTIQQPDNNNMVNICSNLILLQMTRMTIIKQQQTMVKTTITTNMCIACLFVCMYACMSISMAAVKRNVAAAALVAVTDVRKQQQKI